MSFNNMFRQMLVAKDKERSRQQEGRKVRGREEGRKENETMKPSVRNLKCGPGGCSSNFRGLLRKGSTPHCGVHMLVKGVVYAAHPMRLSVTPAGKQGIPQIVKPEAVKLL